MIVKNVSRLAAAVAFVTLTATSAQAQATMTATQVVTFAVNAINQIAFTGAPSLTITTAVAGSAPTSVTNATANWAITTNQSTVKITAALSSAMPTGLTLSANLTAPTLNGTSAGLVALTASTVDMVTSIAKLNEGSLPITYQLDATAAAGVVASATRTVTYTITGGT
jgi:hypothetical protein